MIIKLALLGVAEAAVLLLRCKSAVEPGALRSAFWTFLTCVLRVIFVQTGISAVIDGMPIHLAVAAYALPAAVATFAVHALDDQHELSRQRNAARIALRPSTTPAPPPPNAPAAPKPWDQRSQP